MTNILIVEDDPIISANICLVLRNMGYACVSTDHAREALSLALKQRFDLYLLDISISGDMDGIELAHELRAVSDVSIIFITSYFDHQTLHRAREVEPEAYIVKPFEEKNLSVNVELALFRKRSREKKSEADNLAGKIFVRSQQELKALNAMDIVYVEADDNYSCVHTEADRYLLSHTIKSLENKLSGLGFARIHKTYIVNISKVTSIQDGYVFITSIKLPLGRTYRQSFMKALTIL